MGRFCEPFRARIPVYNLLSLLTRARLVEHPIFVNSRSV